MAGTPCLLLTFAANIHVDAFVKRAFYRSYRREHASNNLTLLHPKLMNSKRYDGADKDIEKRIDSSVIGGNPPVDRD